MSARLCIAIHDVAPATWPACARLLDLLDDLGAPPSTLLVVPDFHHRGRIDTDMDFRRAIDARVSCGDELALHGYTHLDDAPAPRTPSEWLRRRVLTSCEGEFAALSETDAASRIDAGLSQFATCGWTARGFVAPAWLLGDGARAALAHAPIAWTSTHTRLERLDDGMPIDAPAISASARSAWRRAASRTFLPLARHALRTKPLLRLALHPVDAEHDDILASWRDLIAALLAEREAVTKSVALAAIAPSALQPAAGH